MLPRRPGGKARSRALRELAAEQLGLTIQAPPLPLVHLCVGLAGKCVHVPVLVVSAGRTLGPRKVSESRNPS